MTGMKSVRYMLSRGLATTLLCLAATVSVPPPSLGLGHFWYWEIRRANTPASRPWPPGCMTLAVGHCEAVLTGGRKHFHHPEI